MSCALTAEFYLLLQWRLLNNQEERDRIMAEIYSGISNDTYLNLNGSEVTWVGAQAENGAPKAIYMKITYRDRRPFVGESLQMRTEFLHAVRNAIAVPVIIFQGISDCGEEIIIRSRVEGDMWITEKATGGAV